MEIHKMVKDTLRDHKEKIELLQWAIMSGIASLIYPEYLMRIKQKQTPVRRIFVPPIKAVRELVDPNGEFMTYLSNHLIDGIKERLNGLRYKEYAQAPELVLFGTDHDEVEILKTIFDLYMIPNISKRMPESIAKKFRIGDPTQQLMVESNDIDLFDRQPPTDDESFSFLIEEIILQLLALIPTMKKDIELPESNAKIYLAEDDVVMIGNENAICPIYINRMIMFDTPKMYNALVFVTNTCIAEIDWNARSLMKNDEQVAFEMTTGVFNQVAITRFRGIETGMDSENKTDD